MYTLYTLVGSRLQHVYAQKVNKSLVFMGRKKYLLLFIVSSLSRVFDFELCFGAIYACGDEFTSEAEGC